MQWSKSKSVRIIRNEPNQSYSYFFQNWAKSLQKCRVICANSCTNSETLIPQLAKLPVIEFHSHLTSIDLFYLCCGRIHFNPWELNDNQTLVDLNCVQISCTILYLLNFLSKPFKIQRSLLYFQAFYHD